MLKNIAALILFVALCLALPACGNAQNDAIRTMTEAYHNAILTDNAADMRKYRSKAYNTLVEQNGPVASYAEALEKGFILESEYAFNMAGLQKTRYKILTMEENGDTATVQVRYYLPNLKKLFDKANLNDDELDALFYANHEEYIDTLLRKSAQMLENGDFEIIEATSALKLIKEGDAWKVDEENAI